MYKVPLPIDPSPQFSRCVFQVCTTGGRGARLHSALRMQQMPSDATITGSLSFGALAVIFVLALVSCVWLLRRMCILCSTSETWGRNRGGSTFYGLLSFSVVPSSVEDSPATPVIWGLSVVVESVLGSEVHHLLSPTSHPIWRLAPAAVMPVLKNWGYDGRTAVLQPLRHVVCPLPLSLVFLKLKGFL